MHQRRTVIMDGNEAAAYVAYAFTEVAAIYPITPSSPMAEKTDVWSAEGRKNIFGQPVRLVEMQSEAGAAGAIHGALETGALATSYTSSQGLLLMLPVMHRISGQRHPGVLHVAARTVGTHAFSIFGDHSDVMNCRATGFAMLSTSSVQEVMDLAGVAHLAAIKSRVPFLHFFDGFRTSHEISKIEAMEYDELAEMLDREALQAFRDHALNPETPALRSTVQNPDIYFQVREANNRFYDAVPAVVEEYMEQISARTGRSYKLFNYYGAPDATEVIVAMGSVSGAIRETVEHLNAIGRKVGFVQVHLFRPFAVGRLLEAIPETVRRIAVLDRCKEMGSAGEPLYQDVCTAFSQSERCPLILGGRYGLSSKDTTPAQIGGVYENLCNAAPLNGFTVGIVDDVTHRSLLPDTTIPVVRDGVFSCKFWGLGSDGTVGANRNTVEIISSHTDFYGQAYFEYDAKKSFGITKSHLRFSRKPIDSSYLVRQADFIACHHQTFLPQYDMVSELLAGGTFLLNCSWSEAELEEKLPGRVKRGLAEKKAKFYTIDASGIARELGLGIHANIVLQSAFFRLMSVIPADEAERHLRQAVRETYFTKGDAVVEKNLKAVARGAEAVVRVEIPESWASAPDEDAGLPEGVPAVVKNLLRPINAQKGDELPVSAFSGYEDGQVELGLTAYEKRRIAAAVPVWDPAACLQCNQCAFVCPHAAIRPYLLDAREAASAPVDMKTAPAKGKAADGLSYALLVSTDDCTGCGSCASVCPARQKALAMAPIDQVPAGREAWVHGLSISDKEIFDPFTVKGSQFKEPLLEFSAACAGCGETPYAKLLTQLFGDRVYWANATGCTQAWGGAMPGIPYTRNKKGKGPAWSNSLFENNAEFSLGMALSVKQQREAQRQRGEALRDIAESDDLKKSLEAWLDAFDDFALSAKTGEALGASLEKAMSAAPAAAAEAKLIRDMLSAKKHFSRKTFWMYGGDGWAYDIGYGGLDHVLSSGENVNVFIVDTEVYSNTGGQASKATPLGAVAQFTASGKRSGKKDLGALARTYGNVYVAQVSMGADPAQLVRAIREAEYYEGPSVIIAYAPCIAHGIAAGMGMAQQEAGKAVDAGYWHLYRYHPNTGEFILDSKEPTIPYGEFLAGEVRYASLERTFPDNAEALFKKAEQQAADRYKAYKQLQK